MNAKLGIRLVSLLMIAALVCSPLLQASAAGCDCGDPIISVAGVASRPIYTGLGTENETISFPPSTDTLTDAIKEIAVPLIYSAVTDNWDVFCDEAFPVINDVLSPIGFNKDGTPKDGTGIKWNFATIDSHTPNKEYDFNYDWRLDPMVISRQLAQCIDYVLAKTGHDKVKIRCFSMGTAVTMSYLAQFGFDKVGAIVFDSGALNGVSVAGKPLAGELALDSPEGIIRFVENLLRDGDNNNALRAAMNLLRATGLLRYVTDFLNRMLIEIKDRLYDEVMSQTFVYMPGLWCLADDANYEQGKAFVLDANEDAEFIKIIDNYHYNVQKKVKTMIDSGIAQGVKVYFISKYNMQLTPVIDEPDICGDGVIDTHYTSCFATVAPLGSTLGDNYVQAINDGHNHLSADGMIDASTCMYPEYTWFVKNAIHFYSADPYDEFATMLINSDTQLTVRSDARYPQFMLLEQDEKVMRPLLATDADPKPNLTHTGTTFDLILALIKLA